MQTCQGGALGGSSICTYIYIEKDVHRGTAAKPSNETRNTVADSTGPFFWASGGQAVGQGGPGLRSQSVLHAGGLCIYHSYNISTCVEVYLCISVYIYV